MDFHTLIIGFGFVTIITYKETLVKEVNDARKRIFRQIEIIIFQILNIDSEHPHRENFTSDFQLKIKENGLNLKFVDQSIIKKQNFLNLISLLLVFCLIISLVLSFYPSSPFFIKIIIYFKIYVCLLLIIIFYYIYAIFNKLDFLIR